MLLELIAKTIKTPLSALSETSSMHNTPDWDSLRHMILMLRIEEKYGITLTNDEMGDATSIAQVRAVLAARGVV